MKMKGQPNRDSNPIEPGTTQSMEEPCYQLS